MAAPPEKLIAAIDQVRAMAPAKVATPKGLVMISRLLGMCRARIEMDSAWPSQREELTRKAIDAAHALAVRHAEGELSQEAVCAAMGAIIDTTAGLINRDALDVLNNAYRRLRS